ncbi:MAG TPA: transglycosylase SLT domain-containing protein [Terriglobales bacterium]|nr:transglycosylase SLT domain-containing protein [Terriglobales bacterium]
MKRNFSSLLLVLLMSSVAIAAAQSSPSLSTKTYSSSAKARAAARHKTAAKHRRKLTPAQRLALARRAQRARRAFVASSELKPMAQQLLEVRTPAGYAGVEAYARKHPASDAGSLAWLVIAYAHYTDREFDKAVPAFQKAQTHAGELGDYCAYFLANSYLAQGESQPGLELLKTFAARYPDSPFARDAALLYASALITTGDANQAIAALEPYANDAGPDLELARARAYLKAGETEKGAALLRRIYLMAPASPQALDAKSEIDKLPAGSFAPPSFTELRDRAAALANAKRYYDATVEYRSLLGNAPVIKIAEVQSLLAEALYKNNSRNEARALFQKIPDDTDEAAARRNYYLLEMARSDGDEAQVRAILDRMRANTPTSSFLQQALVSAGNMYLLKKDLGNAEPLYREIAQRFPESRMAAAMHWKAAWLALRQGKSDEARQQFEEQISNYPDSGEVAPAVYWRGRLAEEEHDLPRARAYYRKEIERFRNYYYAELARTRLAALGEGETAVEPLLARIPQPGAPRFVEEAAPSDDLRLQRARLLENAAMYDFAVRELQLSKEEDGGSWQNREIARVYQAAGKYDRALEALKRAVPSYFALDLNALPRSYWEALFPRPYWPDLTRYASANDLDPFLVASLIRQESEFNPTVVSYANAWGLMQVLPSTGSKLAHEMKIGRFNSDQLLVPATNLQLGTHYFRALVDRFGGKVEYALAAYNAGPERVDDWLASGSYRDTAEFVESIPFTQTREYVQAIMRNAMVYRQLYAADAAPRKSAATFAKADGDSRN